MLLGKETGNYCYLEAELSSWTGNMKGKCLNPRLQSIFKKKTQQTTTTTKQNLRKLNIYLYRKGGKIENAKGESWVRHICKYSRHWELTLTSSTAVVPRKIRLIHLYIAEAKRIECGFFMRKYTDINLTGIKAQHQRIELFKHIWEFSGRRNKSKVFFKKKLKKDFCVTGKYYC